MRISKENTMEAEAPEGVEMNLEGKLLKIKGPLGEASKWLNASGISISLNRNRIVLKAERLTQREKKLMGTLFAHINNMIKGVTQGVLYKLKVCSGHFPMSVQLKGDEFIVKNFIGEKHPRVLKLKHQGVKVSLDGDLVIVSGVDKEKVAQTAADIEQLLKRVDYDKRIFQDGIYIIEKDGKPIK